jgi:Fe-S-cluster containining protein
LRWFAIALRVAAAYTAAMSDTTDPCRSCGACCSFSANWPAFTTDSDADIAAIPFRFVNDSNTGMRCDGNRCSALSGEVGIATTCLAYTVRPDVCRACGPGDAECNTARQAFGLPVLSAVY